MKRSLNHSLHRTAFSLIELLVVVALIGILSTLLIIGVGKLRTSSKRQQTLLIMTNLTAMYSEFDANTRVPFGMGHLSFNTLTSANQGTILTAIAMDCPENVTEESDGEGLVDRWGIPTSMHSTPNRAVRYTRDFMAMLMQYPPNAAAIGKMSAGSLMTFPATTYPTPPSVWNYANSYNVARASANSDQSDEATDANGNVFIRTQIFADAAGNILTDGQANGGTTDTTNAPPNTYFWMPAIPPAPAASPTLPLSIPVLLDAWGNPIIFVFGGVLGNGSALGTNGVVTPNSGALAAGGTSVRVHASNYRPFFASAGPDGDFSKGDDNIYSFEK